MRKLLNLIGLPVLELSSGTQIGEVQEVVLNLEGARMCGITITETTWFSPRHGVFFHDLFAIGQDAVTISSQEVVKEFTALLESPVIFRLSEICGKQIYTETGEFLGVLIDVGCESKTGEVKYYELSDGLITDFLYGRLVMPLPRAQIILTDKVIVPEVMSELLHTANQEPGGVF